jgi:hypothetical protein
MRLSFLPCLALLWTMTVAAHAQTNGFIRVSGNRFIDGNCADFIPNGERLDL